LSLLLTLASCTDENTDGGVTWDEAAVTNLITNGDFTKYSGTDAPYTATSWSGTNGISGASSIATEQLKAGIINTAAAAYESSKKNWSANVPNPFTNYDGDNKTATNDPYVLMIYSGEDNSLEKTSYYYSQSLSAAAGKYYELKVSVYTMKGAKAHIQLRGSAWYDSGAIDTENAWKTYTFYIAAHKTSSKSVSVRLWNGTASEAGSFAVFFDHVTARELTKKEYDESSAASEKPAETIISLALPNPNFDASSSTYKEDGAPVSPNDYSTVAGASKDSSKASAPGGSSRISYGMVSKDYTNSDAANVGTSIAETPVGQGGAAATPDFPDDGFLLMLWNKDYTAYGYASSSTSGIVMERSKYYAVSVWVRTDNLSFVSYVSDKAGDYYKATDGSYSKIYSAATYIQTDGTSNIRLAIRINLPTKTNTTITRYLDVVSPSGELSFRDSLSDGGYITSTSYENAMISIIDTLYTLKNNSSSSSSNGDIFVTDENVFQWLKDAYAATGNETYNPLNFAEYVYWDHDENPETPDVPKTWDHDEDPETPEVELFETPEYDSEIRAALLDLLANSNGTEEYGKDPTDWAVTYRQFTAYKNAYAKFTDDPAGTSLYFADSESSSASASFYSTSYKYGMDRYYQDNNGEGTPITKAYNKELLAGGASVNELLGGNLKLTAGSTVIEIKGIVTEGEWEEYIFYVRANQFQNTTFAISYNLGEGGAEDVSTHVKGLMFVDTLRLEYADSFAELENHTDLSSGYEFDASVSGILPDKTVTTNDADFGENGYSVRSYVVADISSDENGNLIENWDFFDSNAADSWSLKQPNDIDPEKISSSTPVYKPVDESDYFFGVIESPENAGLPYVMEGKGNVLSLSIDGYGIFTIKPSSAQTSASDNGLGAFEIAPLGYYRLSVWIKTANLPKNSASSVSLYVVQYTENKKGEGIYDGDDGKTYDRAALSSVTGVVTTEDTDNDGWTEVVFYIAGSHAFQNSKYIDLEIVFGSGNYTSPETLAKGDLYIVYPSFYKITYGEYNSASTGTHAKKYEFATETLSTVGGITNGEFDTIDAANSKYGDDGVWTMPGVPSSWTFQDGKIYEGGKTLTKYDVLSGIIDLDNYKLLASLAFDYGMNDIFGFDADWIKSAGDIEAHKDDIKAKAYDVVYGSLPEDSLLNKSNTLLMLTDRVLDGEGGADSMSLTYGYKTSSSKSLSANTYYRISVMAIVLSGTPDNAYIYLTSSTTSPSMIYTPDGIAQKTQYKLENLGTDWREYVFYVEIGQSGVSVNLEFWLGNKEKTAYSTGVVLFDNIRVETVSDITVGLTDYYASEYFDAVVNYIVNNGESNGDYAMFDRTSPITVEGKWIAYGLRDSTYFIAITYVTDSFDSYGDNKSTFVTDNDNLPIESAGDDENNNNEEDEEEDKRPIEDKKKYLYTPIGWIGTTNKGSSSEVVAGVIDLETNVKNVLTDVDDPIDRLYGGMGRNMLVIWLNSDDLSHTYKSSSKTFSSKTIYEVSVYVKTLDLADGGNAAVSLTLDTLSITFNIRSDGPDTKTVYDQRLLYGYGDGAFADADPGDDDGISVYGYTKLTFYVYNEMASSISSVNLSFGLGNSDNGMRGVVGIDNFTIKKFSGSADDYESLLAAFEDDYDNAGKDYTGKGNASAVLKKFDTVAFLRVPDSTTINPPVDDEPAGNAAPNLQWLVISSAVVGGLTVVIVLVYFYQRKKDAALRFVNEKIFKGKLTVFKAAKSRQRGVSPAVREIRDEYDKFRDD
jgi:hypothetical protein